MTIYEARKEAKETGYVRNCQAIEEYGSSLMTAEGIENQLKHANLIIAHAEKVRIACLEALKEAETQEEAEAIDDALRLSILPGKVERSIDVHMAYFHPEETIFTKERQEEHMLGALSDFSEFMGVSHPETNTLRGLWFARNKAAMYQFLNQYID